ncbi:MAG: SMC-Scp complex subunit ScpB, partial [Erythrobacter sp.]|nr:SMC-Scp complex subunit ScpB [Erythrobacter sp.]
GTLDVLMEAGWVRVAGRREVPGRPVIYATTPEFLSHFGLESRKDLPGIAELKASGLLDPVDDAYDGLMAERADAPDAGESEGSESLGYDDPDEDGDEFEPGLASREESA